MRDGGGEWRQDKLGTWMERAMVDRSRNERGEMLCIYVDAKPK